MAKLKQELLDLIYENKVEIQRILDIDEISEDLDKIRGEK